MIVNIKIDYKFQVIFVKNLRNPYKQISKKPSFLDHELLSALPYKKAATAKAPYRTGNIFYSRYHIP